MRERESESERKREREGGSTPADSRVRAQSRHDPVESCDGKEEKGLEGWKEREKNERERN